MLAIFYIVVIYECPRVALKRCSNSGLRIGEEIGALNSQININIYI